MIGVLDRFEGDIAVILIEEVKSEIHINKANLPAGSEVNTIFQLEEANNTYKIIGIDQEITQQRKQTTSSLMNKLRSKKGKSRLKRR